MIHGRTRPPAPRKSEAQTRLIKELGGPTAVANLIGDEMGYRLRPQAVSMWIARGIPYVYRPTLALAAGRIGIEVPPDFLRYVPSPPQPPAPPVEAEADDDVPEFLRESA